MDNVMGNQKQVHRAYSCALRGYFNYDEIELDPEFNPILTFFQWNCVDKLHNGWCSLSTKFCNGKNAVVSIFLILNRFAIAFINAEQNSEPRSVTLVLGLPNIVTNLFIKASATNSAV